MKINLSISNFKSVRSVILINLIICSLYITLNLGIRYELNKQLSYSFRSEYDENILLTGSFYDYVSVGTSHGVNSIDFNYFGIKGLNLAKAGQPFKYDLEKLNYYGHLIDNNTIIIVPVSFHSFCLVDEEWLPHEVIYKYKFPILGMSRILTLRTYLQYTDVEKSGFETEFNNKPNKITLPSNCDTKKAFGYLEMIIQNHEKVILITTPYFIEFLGASNDYDEFYDSVNTLTNKYNLDYLDYSRDPRFQNSTFFYDSNHLNLFGRRLFTSILIDDIDRIFKNEIY
jgi:hypothetical protein